MRADDKQWPSYIKWCVVNIKCLAAKRGVCAWPLRASQLNVDPT